MRKQFAVAVLLMTLLAPFGVGEAEPASPILEEIENAFIRLGEEVRPSVVNIEADRVAEGPGRGMPDMDMFEDFFRFFGIPRDEMMPGPRPDRQRRVPATGSGFIIDKEGHIITNNHVIRDAESITVRLHNGDEYSAEIVGGDRDTDVAVIKINSNQDLPVAELGDSDEIKVGQFAIAIGSPQGLEGSLSFGHISALGREGLRLPDDLRFQNFIQTDAAINLGNSGGPLVNIRGEVIGINTAIVFGAESLGFAIPINLANRVVPELIAEGRVTRGYLGVQIRDASAYADGLGLPDSRGAFVDAVQPDTPAERAGIQIYDVIRKVNDIPIEGASDLVYTISDIAPDTTVTLEVWRDGETVEVDVVLDEYDAPEVRAEADPEDHLGLQVRELTPEMIERLDADFEIEGGVLITGVDPFGAAGDADLRQGDIILEIARQQVNSIADYQRLVREYAQPGMTTLMRVLRGGQHATVVSVTVPETENE